MGRFSNKVSAATKQRSSIIKVNPYELPEKALQVIANICTKQNRDDASVIFHELERIRTKKDNSGLTFDEFIKKNRQQMDDIDFVTKLYGLVRKIEIELSAHENTNDTQVVIAGGFSAGKSSFLNTITGLDNLLPTGTDPVSMISTYLYFSDKIKEITIKGVNLKNAIVQLDKDVLQCIQHTSSSKEYLASVLNKLFVEIPSKELTGLVFIDTPGYNNSNKANDANGKSDEATATESFDDGNVLFWVVDIESGAVPAKDKYMIHKFLEAHKGDGRVVIIFNKADKKPANDIRTIVDNTAREYGLGTDSSVIDVIAYSCVDNKIHYSKRGNTIKQLLDTVRNCGTGNSIIYKYLADIKELFDNEINFSRFILDHQRNERKRILDDKNQRHQFYIEDKNGCKDYIDKIDNIMVSSYNEVLSAAEQLGSSSLFAINSFLEFCNNVSDVERSRVFGSSELGRIISRAYKTHEKAANKHIAACQYSYWYEKDRKHWVNSIKDELYRLNGRYKSDYEKHDEEEKKVVKKIKEIEQLANGLYYYKVDIIDTLNRTIRNYKSSAHKPQDARVIKNSNKDVFSAISSGNYSDFMECFTEGVSLTNFSPDGHSPLTYAVKEGAIEMVRFFIKHNADISASDKYGNNAFHTAVIYGYRNICELLLKEDPSIATSKTANGMSVEQLLTQNTFNNWLKSNI